jgi:alpha-L-rhamnosidase
MAGKYVFDYMPTSSYILTYSTNNSLSELLNNEETKKIFEEELPEVAGNPIVQGPFAEKTLREIVKIPLFSRFAPSEKLDELDKRLELVRQ